MISGYCASSFASYVMTKLLSVFCGPKGCFIGAVGVSVFLPGFLQTRKNGGFLRKNAVLFELWGTSNHPWPIRAGTSVTPCGAWVSGFLQSGLKRPAPEVNLPKSYNTRNQFAGNRTRVRIPPSPPEKSTLRRAFFNEVCLSTREVMLHFTLCQAQYFTAAMPRLHMPHCGKLQ